MSTSENFGKTVRESGGTGTENPKSEPWYKKISLSKKGKKDSWMNKLIRKSLIFTIVALVLGIVMLIINPWPGCLISIAMLLFAVITGAFGIIIQTMDMEDYIHEKGEKKAASMINHILNIILIWGFFFFVLGIVCLFISWWAVLIAEAIGFIGMLAMLVLGLEAFDNF